MLWAAGYRTSAIHFNKSVQTLRLVLVIPIEAGIESGVDVPTVARWLGHKDGGALAMKVYGHLRDEHSVNMARKVSFSPAEPSRTQTEETAAPAE